VSFEIKVPARINILGNPSDANEGAHQTISAAINIWAGVICRPAPEWTLSSLVHRGDQDFQLSHSLALPQAKLPAYGTEFDLALAALRTLLAHSPEFREKFPGRPLSLGFWSDVPRQSGLGGSTLIVLNTLVAMVHWFGLDRKRHNPYVLAELTQRAEEQELDITCGFADRYVPLFGDIAYLDYRGKLFHRPFQEEPYVTYEKLGHLVEPPPLVAVSSGVPHHSGDLHRPMRARYLQEYRQFQGDYDRAPFMVKIMKQIGDLAWQGKIALLEGDLPRFGELMNENHRRVDEMMHYCGHPEGAGEANHLLIRAGREAGALGAKLTGAGGGGSGFMLVEPGRQPELAARLEKRLIQFGMKEGRVYIPSLVRQGLVILDHSA
jgi:galactokinase